MAIATEPSGLDLDDVQPLEYIFDEGDEEAMYLLLSVEGLQDAQVPRAGDSITIRGLDTARPSVLLPGGATLSGRYTETVGTYMVFREQRSGAPDSAPGPCAAPPQQQGTGDGSGRMGPAPEDSGDGNGEVGTGPGQGQLQVTPLALTDKLLQCAVVLQAPQQSQ